MSSPLDDPVRRMVPRWRPWRETARLGLLTPSRSTRTPLAASVSEVDLAEAEWVQNRTIGYAGDFMGIAVSNGCLNRAVEAAEFVMGLPRVPRALMALAEDILSGDEATLMPPPELPGLDESRSRITSIKAYLKRCPRDALTWMDLARQYFVLGQRKSARRPVEIALALAPNSRFVILTASRCFLALEEPDRAHAILRACERVKADPWILAAELAMTQVLSRTSDLIKTARRTVKAGQIPTFHLSELACALGSVEMEGGSRRTTRRLFEVGLTDPTENSVAQAEWVLRSNNGIQIEPGRHAVARQYEARAWSQLRDEHWQESVDAAKMWLRDEPFSGRPAKFGSWVAQVVTGDFETSAEFAKVGLDVDPADSLLLNNLAVCLANLGHVRKARKTFDRIRPAVAKAASEATYCATQGLLGYRQGTIEEGRACYAHAVRCARTQRERVWALLYWAREEHRVDPEVADIIYREGVAALDELPRWERSVASRIRGGTSGEETVGGDR